MKLQYTLEEIKEAGKVIQIVLDEKGIRENIFNIVKITPKKVYFDGTFNYRNMSYRSELFHEEVSCTIENVGAGASSSHSKANRISINTSVIVLEKDVKIAKEEIIRLAKIKANDFIQQLNNQLDVLDKTVI